VFTAIAITFVIVLVGLIFYGYGIVMKRSPTEEELKTEKCSICRRRFPLAELVEREVGDYKLLYFCGECIASLVDEAKKRHGISDGMSHTPIPYASEKHESM